MTHYACMTFFTKKVQMSQKKRMLRSSTNKIIYWITSLLEEMWKIKFKQKRLCIIHFIVVIYKESQKVNNAMW